MAEPKTENASGETPRQLVARQWEPIETAPKDATEILGRYVDHGRVVVRDAHWACDLSGSDQPSFIGWFYWSGYDFRELPNDPTHWMPLPPPPEILGVRAAATPATPPVTFGTMTVQGNAKFGPGMAPCGTLPTTINSGAFGAWDPSCQQPAVFTVAANQDAATPPGETAARRDMNEQPADWMYHAQTCACRQFGTDRGPCDCGLAPPITEALPTTLLGKIAGIDGLVRNALVVAEGECALRLVGVQELAEQALSITEQIRASLESRSSATLSGAASQDLK